MSWRNGSYAACVVCAIGSLVVVIGNSFMPEDKYGIFITRHAALSAMWCGFALLIRGKK